MSHFVVGVITETGESQEVERLLAPFHEFECTGIDDEFVQDVDVTEEALRDWKTNTTEVLRDTAGCFHSFFDEAGSWKPEFSQLDPDRPKWDTTRRIKYAPPGYEIVRVPYAEVEPFHIFAESWYGVKPLRFGELPDLQETHKYGYCQLDEAGNGVKVIDRTNPGKKWDWWTVGGRWKDWIVKGDVGKVSDLKPNPEREGPNYFFAVLTPNGEWVEKGRMGWWASVTNEKEDWPEVEKTVLDKYQDKFVTVVDCHI